MQTLLKLEITTWVFIPMKSIYGMKLPYNWKPALTNKKYRTVVVWQTRNCCEFVKIATVTKCREKFETFMFSGNKDSVQTYVQLCFIYSAWLLMISVKSPPKISSRSDCIVGCVLLNNITFWWNLHCLFLSHKYLMKIIQLYFFSLL